MRRTEFLEELGRLLADLPEEERKAAILYYDDYLQDAGQENEQDVIRELGGPEKVAATIRADYYGRLNKKRLYRSRNSRMLCGVCGGIGEYLNIDPTLIRLLAVLLGCSGTGIIVYIIAAIIIPDSPE